MRYSTLGWSDAPKYGEVFFARATGKAPEMESSKATSKQLKGLLVPNAHLLDVGCGAGHYLRSLRRAYPFPFHYEGADITPYYIRLAKKAHAHDSLASFHVASIEKLPYKSKAFDIVICCNVLLHLPDIAKPIRELWRVTRGTLLVRTYIGTSNLRIHRVDDPTEYKKGKVDPIFTAQGEPKTKKRNYYNIYSERYVRWLCESLPGAQDVTIHRDEDFDAHALGASQWPDNHKPDNITEMLNGWQVMHDYILQPWCFLRVTRKKSVGRR